MIRSRTRVVQRHPEGDWCARTPAAQGRRQTLERTRHAQDLVYHLGDFAFDDPDPYLEPLNGQKYLIIGNHDHSDRIKKATRWQGIRELKEIKVGETKIVLCHYALRTWNGSHQGALQLYGQR